MSDSENPAEILRRITQQIVQRPLDDGENAHFDRLAAYCDEPVTMNPTSSEKWSVVSRNERTIVIDGVRYFATRCSIVTGWTVEQLDQLEINGSRSVRKLKRGLTTRQLTALFEP